jgi:hypothetical protein
MAESEVSGRFVLWWDVGTGETPVAPAGFYSELFDANDSRRSVAFGGETRGSADCHLAERDDYGKAEAG